MVTVVCVVNRRPFLFRQSIPPRTEEPVHSTSHLSDKYNLEGIFRQRNGGDFSAHNLDAVVEVMSVLRVNVPSDRGSAAA
jgi:hypothetical protein